MEIINGFFHKIILSIYKLENHYSWKVRLKFLRKILLENRKWIKSIFFHNIRPINVPNIFFITQMSFSLICGCIFDSHEIQENVWSEITEGIMNILFIHPVMFHPQRGGIERVSDLLCREFIRRGHNVLCLHNVRDESRMDYAYPASSYFSHIRFGKWKRTGCFSVVSCKSTVLIWS